jgi:hypothetical protein
VGSVFGGEATAKVHVGEAVGGSVKAKKHTIEGLAEEEASTGEAGEDAWGTRRGGG